MTSSIFLSHSIVDLIDTTDRGSVRPPDSTGSLHTFHSFRTVKCYDASQANCLFHNSTNYHAILLKFHFELYN